MKKDQYIPHDVSMRSNSDVFHMVESEGAAGYGLYWGIMEYLRSQNNYRGDIRAIKGIARQYLSVGVGNDTWNMNLKGEHYRNELSPNEHKDTWLTDLSLHYNIGKWRWSASLNNLFNQKEYRYTTYSDIRCYTSWMKMRPREAMISVQYQW